VKQKSTFVSERSAGKIGSHTRYSGNDPREKLRTQGAFLKFHRFYKKIKYSLSDKTFSISAANISSLVGIFYIPPHLFNVFARKLNISSRHEIPVRLPQHNGLLLKQTFLFLSSKNPGDAPWTLKKVFL
jgi:hypothetical protein